MNDAVFSGPFYQVVDQLATIPMAGTNPAAEADVVAAIGNLTPDQQDVILSGDWGRIQQALNAELALRQGPATSSGLQPSPPIGPDNPWNLRRLSARVEAIKASLGR